MTTLDLIQPPQFECIEDERLHRKQRLAATFRLFAYYGFEEGASGHITVRDPEFHDCFWVNPFGMYFGHIKVSDLVLMNNQGEILEGNHPVNISAFAIHSQIHLKRPDVESAVHVHSTYGKTWSVFERLLAPITQEACLFYEDHALFKDYTGLIEDISEGERITVALGNKKAIILRNHGLLTVGHSVDEAAWWFIIMERCCQVQLLAESVGKLKLIEPEIAQLTCKQLGTHYEAWFNFQPLYDMILKKESDLLQ
ncbi:class II aldolase/adducin family protein [Crocosphaera sp. XPORK-15E]|uniref:class II aldolase/adducin family protein n=1 Tax=Crocosphaera sp. XPORK-15E TaxID=3110247 RepID=UPI002B20B004|nr:class II aldolase/adducin family protein [Crocosphaera sp. XPORK-15E]MEA5536958.1 class II aldolase/adducin family protein [Crocosphaera sp. XPORK-15E]